MGNRLPEGGFEDERNVRRFLYSPLDLCMLEEQGVEEGLEDSIVWGSARYCPDGRHPKRNSPHHVKVELSRGLPTSREVKSARVKLETWKWLKKQPLQLEVFRADTREV